MAPPAKTNVAINDPNKVTKKCCQPGACVVQPQIKKIENITIQYALSRLSIL